MNQAQSPTRATDPGVPGTDVIGDRAPTADGTSVATIAPVEWARIAAVFLVGALVRMYTLASADFAANDGGLFYQMVLDLRESWPALPVVTSYNAGDVPFAYPPAGLYLGAALHDWFGGLEMMRTIPVLLSSLTVPAVYLLARAMYGPTLVPFAAAMAFALMPRSFEWLIMGGGLTRALGMLVALIALWLTWRLLDRPSVVRACLVGAAGGLTFLSHPQAGVFFLVGVALFAAARARTRPAIRALAIAAAVAAGVVVPWIAAVAATHGISPFLSAGGTQTGFAAAWFNIQSLEYTGSALGDVLGVFALVGLAQALLRGHWLVPAWFGAILLIDPRAGLTYITVPASLLAAEAIVGLVDVMRRSNRDAESSPAPKSRRLVAAGLLVGAVVVAVSNAFGTQVLTTWDAQALSGSQRNAMAWVADNADPDDAYLVLSGRPWARDFVSEWFPVLASARSVATVQGTEWLGLDVFTNSVQRSDELRVCAREPSSCLASWSERWDADWSHVFLPKGSVSGRLGDEDCCSALRHDLRTDAEYRVVYDGPGATIAERRDS